MVYYHCDLVVSLAHYYNDLFLVVEPVYVGALFVELGVLLLQHLGVYVQRKSRLFRVHHQTVPMAGDRVVGY